MRIRILDHGDMSLDGVDLSVFHAGQVYEVDPSVATYLISSSVAEPCLDGAAALVVRTNEVMVGVFAGGVPPPPEVADEWEEEGPPNSAA